MKKVFTFSAFMTILSCFPAFGDTAEINQELGFYRVRVGAAGETCEKEAEKLATRFTAMTGIKTVNPKCSATTTITAEGKNYVIYTLDFEYPLANAPQYQAFHYGHSDALSDSNSQYYGFYHSLESCLTEVSNRSQEFEKHTGFRALSASCSRSQNPVENSYVLTVDSFGDQAPQRRLYTANTEVSHYIKENVAGEIRRIILQSGGEIVGESGKFIYFYSAEPFRLNKMSFGLFDDAASCATQKKAGQSILSKAEMPSFFVYCVSFMKLDSPKRDLIAIWNGQSTPYSRTVNDKYYSLQECENDKARAQESMKDPEHSIHGAICHPDDLAGTSPRHYIMDMYLTY
jgi:hypothetical protein